VLKAVVTSILNKRKVGQISVVLMHAAWLHVITNRIICLCVWCACVCVWCVCACAVLSWHHIKGQPGGL